MIYVFTQRECWSLLRAGVRFALTTALLGIAAVWLSMALLAMIGSRRRTEAAQHHRGCVPTLCRAVNRASRS